MKIAILTPTRQRPFILDRLIRSVFELACEPNTISMYNYIDNDDPELSNYKLLSDNYKWNVINHYDEHRWQAMAWNVLARLAYKDGADILITGNDDSVYRTRDWDIILKYNVIKYPDRIFCMWFEDRIHGSNHASFPIVSRVWYETVGYFVPNINYYTETDTWVFDVAKRVGRLHFIPNVINEHMHYIVNKGAFDDTYRRRLDHPMGHLPSRSAATTALDELCAERQNDAEKLKKVIERCQKFTDFDRTKSEDLSHQN